MTDYDRTPTSAAERVRWRVSNGGRFVVTDEGAPEPVAWCSTPGLAACAAHDHNVMVAAREQRAMRGETTSEGAT